MEDIRDKTPRSRFPQVLLLGNGINQAYGSGSWDALLKTISCNSRIPDGARLHSPMPLQAVLVSEDKLGDMMRRYRTEREEECFGSVAAEGLTKTLQSLLALRFDHILTTNYSYELEAAALSPACIGERRLKAMTRHTDVVNRAETRSLLHTYNEVAYDGCVDRIWHIHGEARKPDSMILGHYYYGKLFLKLSKYLEKQADHFQKCELENKKPEILSWTDAFILSDLYILGFGYDLSEFDLWWLLNRKKRENAKTGNTYYFTPALPASDGSINEKTELLRVMGVDIKDCGMTKPANMTEGQKAEFYTEFYRKALKEIEKIKIERENDHV